MGGYPKKEMQFYYLFMCMRGIMNRICCIIWVLQTYIICLNIYYERTWNGQSCPHFLSMNMYAQHIRNSLYHMNHLQIFIINRETVILGRCRMGRADSHIYPYIMYIMNPIWCIMRIIQRYIIGMIDPFQMDVE